MDRQIILVQEEPRGPSELIEVKVQTAVDGRVPFPDSQQLRSLIGANVIIKSMRLITAKVLSHAPLSGQVNAPVTELRKAALVLYSEGWEKGHYIPLLLLNDIFDSDATTATTIPFRAIPTKLDNWRNVDWTKSYLQYANGQNPAGTPYSILFELEYVRLDVNNQVIIGPS